MAIWVTLIGPNPCPPSGSEMLTFVKRVTLEDAVGLA
jgi:hypothetical protein